MFFHGVFVVTCCDLPLSYSVAFLVVELRGEHGMDTEVFHARATEFVKFLTWQMDLEELFMLRLQLLLFGKNDLAFLLDLVQHEVF